MQVPRILYSKGKKGTCTKVCKLQKRSKCKPKESKSFKKPLSEPEVTENRSFLGVGTSERQVGTRKMGMIVSMVDVFFIHI